MSEDFNGFPDKNAGGRRRAVYHNGFQDSMRRFLRGDEGCAGDFMMQILNRSDAQGNIQYMTNNNGFTLMDLVSYDNRHNEANGEEKIWMAPHGISVGTAGRKGRAGSGCSPSAAAAVEKCLDFKYFPAGDAVNLCGGRIWKQSEGK